MDNDLRIRFEKIRESGSYNMFMDAKSVASKLGLTVDEYFKFLETM